MSGCRPGGYHIHRHLYCEDGIWDVIRQVRIYNSAGAIRVSDCDGLGDRYFPSFYFRSLVAHAHALGGFERKRMCLGFGLLV